VCARNISAGGLSFIHGGYLHPGSECRIVLPRRDGSPLPVTGVIVHCRHVEGCFHEIGIQFSQELDPGSLLPQADADQLEADGQTRELPALEGQMLVVDQSDSDRKLMTHQLAVTGLAITMVDTTGAALDALRRREFQIMLCDLNLRGDAIRMIKQIRKTEYQGPIIVVTAESVPARLAEARAAGANEIIGKPYNPLYLASLLAEAAHQLEKTLDAGETGGVREICLALAGSGTGHGFPVLTIAARDAMTALDTSQSRKDVEAPLRRLIAICQQLRCGNAVRPLKGQWAGDKGAAYSIFLSLLSTHYFLLSIAVARLPGDSDAAGGVEAEGLALDRAVELHGAEAAPDQQPHDLVGHVHARGDPPLLAMTVGVDEGPDGVDHAAGKVGRRLLDDGHAVGKRRVGPQPGPVLEPAEHLGDAQVIQRERRPGPQRLEGPLEHPDIDAVVLVVAEAREPVDRGVAGWVGDELKRVGAVELGGQALVRGRLPGLLDVGRGPVHADDVDAAAGQRQAQAADPAALVEEARALCELQHAMQKLDGPGDVLRVGRGETNLGVCHVEERVPPGRLVVPIVAHGPSTWPSV
jgi:CheY-like chemotaxis protein